MSQDQYIGHIQMENSLRYTPDNSNIINISDETKLLSENEKTIINVSPDEISLKSEDIRNLNVMNDESCRMKHELQQTWDQSLASAESTREQAAKINFGPNLNDEMDSNNITSILLTDDPSNSLNRSLSDISSTFLKKTTLQFITYALGICCSFITSGIFSEKLLRGSFGPNKETFSFVCVFVFVQNVVNHIYAEILLCTLFKKDEDKTDKKYYAFASFSNCLSMYLANKSLNWINYPTQVLGKSIKPIPVMIFNVIIGKQRYSLKKYCFVTLVVLGVSIFVMMNKSSANLHINLGWGELCVAVSLILDGITGKLIPI